MGKVICLILWTGHLSFTALLSGLPPSGAVMDVSSRGGGTKPGQTEKEIDLKIYAWSFNIISVFDNQI